MLSRTILALRSSIIEAPFITKVNCEKAAEEVAGNKGVYEWSRATRFSPHPGVCPAGLPGTGFTFDGIYATQETPKLTDHL